MRDKMNFWDRVWNWIQPYSQEELDLIALEVEDARENQRILKIEADRLQRISDEEDEAARRRRHFMIVAVAEFSCSRQRDGKHFNCIIRTTLKTNDLGDRKITYLMVNQDTGGSVDFNEQSALNYLRNQNSYLLYMEAWLEGGLQLKDLRNIKDHDDAFLGIDFVEGEH